MKRNHAKLEPISIAKLIKSLGDKQAADSLGLTPPALKRYLKNGKAPYATEIAAQSIVASNINKDITAVISGDQNIIEAVKLLIESNNGVYKKIH